MDTFERITLDPAVMGGKACIRNLRVSVGTVVGLLAAGRSPDEILEAYPYLEREDIDAALAYAAWRVEEREVPLAQPTAVLCRRARTRQASKFRTSVYVQYA